MDKTEVNIRLMQAFVALQILGGVSFILILLSAIVAQYRGASRHPTFFSFCLAWIIFCVAYSLLFLAGQQTIIPDHKLCIVQSALIYSAPPLASSATVSVVTHLLLNILSALSVSSKKQNSFVSAALVIVPWVVWLAVLISLLLFGLHNPALVERSYNGTYCILVHTALPKLTSTWSTVASAVLIIEETAIAILLHRHRNIMAVFGRSVSMAVRVGIFTIICIAAIGVGLVFVVTAKRGVQFDVLISIIPFSASVIFGSQKDLLSVWKFWRCPAKERNRDGPTIDSTAFTTVLSTTTISTYALHGQEM